MTDKQKQKVYVPVSVDERLPVRETIYAEPKIVLLADNTHLQKRIFYSDNTFDNSLGKVTHWLEETEGIFTKQIKYYESKT